jgi:hypothetical protein
VLCGLIPFSGGGLICDETIGASEINCYSRVVAHAQTIGRLGPPNVVSATCIQMVRETDVVYKMNVPQLAGWLIARYLAIEVGIG